MRARDLYRRSDPPRFQVRTLASGVEVERVTPQFDNAARAQRSAAFVYSVLRRSFPDGPAVGRFIASAWPARSGAGRNHSTVPIYEGYLILLYESSPSTWERVLELLEQEGCSPPPAYHSSVGPSLTKWLSKRRVAVRSFKDEIVKAGGDPPRWLVPERYSG